ncbi:MAG: ATP-binding protein [Blautia sp.]
MILKQLVLKNFGKFHQTSLELKDGINIIYGTNESGKSTVHAFIKCMLFGVRRQRGRASRTDEYTKYTPWENPGWFEGGMVFSCGEKDFYLERNFRRGEESVRLVCRTDGELLSVEDGDLSVLLGGVSESIYENTVSVGQMKSRTGEGLVYELRNYFSNYQGSQDGKLDIEKAERILKNRKKEWGKIREEKEIRKKKEEEKLSYETEYLKKELGELECRISELTAGGKSGKEERSKKRILITGGITCLLALLLCTIAGKILIGVSLAVMAAGVSILLYRNVRPEENFRKNNLRLLRSQMQEKRVRFSNLKEELEELERTFAEDRREQEEIEAIEMAEEKIRELVVSMQESAGKKLQKQISHIFREMTEGRYQQVSVDDNLELYLFEKERHVPLFMVSSGTVEQVYLALRLAAADLLCQEEQLPVILDEIFAMYDDRRLMQTLKWLSKKRQQIILFTCNHREAEILKQCGIPFHFIELHMEA